MEWYVIISQQHPILTAMVQFAILGTLGEILGFWVRGGKGFPFRLPILLGKMVIWAGLAVVIKYVFTGFPGFVSALCEHGMLPVVPTFPVLNAFFIAAFMNIMFGPILFFSHRFLDNALERKSNWQGMKPALLTFIWFWIPAQTITFSLEVDYRIGLAAVWSVVLGVILGFFARGHSRKLEVALETSN